MVVMRIQVAAHIKKLVVAAVALVLLVRIQVVTQQEVMEVMEFHHLLLVVQSQEQVAVAEEQAEAQVLQ
jgi:hypothetical protein